jgi:hypothetical protein
MARSQLHSARSQSSALAMAAFPSWSVMLLTICSINGLSVPVVTFFIFPSV